MIFFLEILIRLQLQFLTKQKWKTYLQTEHSGNAVAATQVQQCVSTTASQQMPVFQFNEFIKPPQTGCKK